MLQAEAGSDLFQNVLWPRSHIQNSKQGFASSSATLGCFHLVRTRGQLSLIWSIISTCVSRILFPFFLTNISVNDLEVVAEILVDALLLNQTCLWNASKIFACFHGAGLSAHCPIYCSDLVFFFACLAVQITGLNAACLQTE